MMWDRLPRAGGPAGLMVRHGEKIRFLVIGAWNTLFGLAVLWVLDAAIPYDPGSLVEKQGVLLGAWVVSVTHNYLTFKLLVFRTRGNWLREYLKIYSVYAALFAVQSVLMLTISQVFGLSVFWATLPTLVVVTVMSYVGHTCFTFRRVDDVFEAGTGGPGTVRRA